jgi:hypothetical protein
VPLANGHAELVVTLDAAPVEADPREVMRYLGYPAGAKAHAEIAARVEQTLRDARAAQRPRGTYSLYRIADLQKRSIGLDGGARFTGPVGEFLGGSTRIAAFLATAGPEVVAMAEDAFRARDTIGGLVCHALGAALVEAVVDCLVADLRDRIAPGEELTLRYSPGYCGISLAQQRTLFTLVDAGSIGVELLPSLIMKPLKSVSGMIGIGPKEAVTAYGNPCDRCPMVDCAMRR